MFRASSTALRAAPSSVTYVMKAASIRAPNSSAARHTSLSVPVGVLPASTRFPTLVGEIPENRTKLEEMTGDDDPMKYEWSEEGDMLVAHHLRTGSTGAAPLGPRLGSISASANRLITEVAEARRDREVEWTDIMAAVRTGYEAASLAQMAREDKVMEMMASRGSEVSAPSIQRMDMDDAMEYFPASCYLLLSAIGEGLLSTPGRCEDECAYDYKERCLDAALKAKETDLLKIEDEETRRTCTTLVKLFTGGLSGRYLRKAHSSFLATPTEFADYLEKPVYYGIDQICPKIGDVVDVLTAELLVRQWGIVYEKYRKGEYRHMDGYYDEYMD